MCVCRCGKHPKCVRWQRSDLDSSTGRQIIALMRQLVEEQRMTILAVTHDPVVVETADTVHELLDGRLIS